jgi:signal transduction histidine kinase
MSPLIDRRGFNLGRLVWFHDVTELKQAQRQLLDRQRTLAMLEERELLARELHDGIGQMIAAANLQVKSASEFLARGEKNPAESCLRRVAEVTQEAKESIRTYLLGVKAGSPSRRRAFAVPSSILTTSAGAGLTTEVVVSPELETKQIDASVEAQLQPIIHEALTNTRRHAEAGLARVILASSDGWVQVTIEDDGRGFNPEEIRQKQGFGLRSMRGRAEAVGGLVEVNSAPGKGTRVIVHVPWGKEKT